MQGEANWPAGSDESPLMCDRCLRLLREGRGDYFAVQIKALADPSPPDLDAYEEQDSKAIRESYEALVRQLDGVSDSEAREQVIRQLHIVLCRDCFPTWIENPAGARVD